MEELSKLIKNLFREKINIVICLLIISLILNLGNVIFESKNAVKILKKVDYRYFNTTRTLEDIHNIEIDTYKGELKRVKN